MLRLVTLCIISCLALSSPASAQFGSLGKKAKEKAEKEAAKALGAKPAESGGTLKFDNTLLELTTPVVNQVLAGLKVRANMKDAQGRNSAQLRQQATKAYEDAEALNRDRSDERFQYNNKRGEAQNCYDEHMRATKEKVYVESQQKFMAGGNMNMAFMTEYGRISGEMAQAVTAGDTAKANQLEADLYQLLGYDMKAEKAKAEAACKIPQMPAWMARADSLNELSNRLYDQGRALEEKSNAAAVKASGQTAEQFAMGVERVTAHCGGAGGLWKFSKIEETALKDAKPQICPLVG